MLFREEFSSRQAEIKAKLEVAIACAAAVRASRSLQEVFALVLTVGNFINQGHMLGNALAFTFASTALLVGNKLSNRRGTLVHFIVEALERKESTATAELEALMHEHVKKALAFSIDYLVVEVSEVSSACHGAQATISKLSKDLDSLDDEHRPFAEGFISRMSTFLHTAGEEVKQLGDMQVQLQHANAQVEPQHPLTLWDLGFRV